MQLKSYLTHKNIFLFGLVLLAVSIPVSRFFANVAQILLICNWILEGNFTTKWNKLKQSKSFWAFTGIYLFYVLGILWTGDFEYAAKELGVKSPILILPLLFFTSSPLNKKEYQSILHFFVATTLVATFWSLMVYLGITNIKIHDIRDISRFESHIRFSLMIVFSILYLFFMLIKKEMQKYRLIYALVLVWFLYFLTLLQSFTGIFIIGIIGFTALSWVLISKNSVLLKISFSVLVVGGLSYLLVIIVDEWKKVHEIEAIDLKNLPQQTKNHHWYVHDTANKATENGKLVWINVVYEELEKEWGKRSRLGYSSLDFKGNSVSTTMIRYLTSKGLTKDSIGLYTLSQEDILNIENGHPNYLYTDNSHLRTRIHELIWELDASSQKQDPTGHSLTMRFEFWKTAWHIIKKNPLIGVGTGDLEKAMKEQYKTDKTSLNPKWQLHSPNQFLAVGVALGFAGIILFILYLLAPFLFTKQRSKFFVFFLLIQFLSFFNEDTLETQAGVTFCVFFTQLLFHNDEYNL